MYSISNITTINQYFSNFLFARFPNVSRYAPEECWYKRGKMNALLLFSISSFVYIYFSYTTYNANNNAFIAQIQAAYFKSQDFGLRLIFVQIPGKSDVRLDYSTFRIFCIVCGQIRFTLVTKKYCRLR